MYFLDDDEDEELNVDDLPEDDDEEDVEDTDDEEENEDEEESDDEDEDEEEIPAKKSRAQDRIRRLSAARREKERENLELRQKLDAITAQQNAQTSQQHNQAGKAAYLASLPPEQRVQAELQISLQEHQQFMNVQKFQMADTADKSAFDAKAINNPLYARYAAKVELKLADLRKNQNITAPREEVLKHLLGEAMLKVKGKVTSKKDAKKSVTKNSVKPTSGKKNDVNGGTRKGKTARDRLEGVRF